MEENREVVWENIVSDGKTESRITFYENGHIELRVRKIVVDSVQE